MTGSRSALCSHHSAEGAGSELIIEFAGPSCSGKSTLVRRLEQELHDQGLAPLRVKAWRTEHTELLRAVVRPRVMAWCLLNPRLVPGFAARQLLGAMALTHRLRRGEGLVLLDEGPVKLHKRRSLRKARGERLLWSAMPAPDVLVIVTCDPEVRLTRLRREDRPHARGLSDQDVLTDVTGDHFAHRFAAARQVPLVEIDTSSGQDAFPTMYEQLRPFLAGPATRPLAQ